MGRRKKSIQTKIFSSFVILILAIFFILACGVHFLAQIYIRQAAMRQMTNAVYTVIENENIIYLNYDYINKINAYFSAPDKKLGTTISVFVADKNYKVIEQDSNQDIETEQKIVEKLLKKSYFEQNFDDDKILITVVDKYYVWGEQFFNPFAKEMQTILVYLDATLVYNFASLINMFLFSLMGIAMIVASIIAMVISMKISRPIFRLGQFASRIGDGEFGILENEFNTYEINALRLNMNQTAKKLAEFDSEQKAFFQNVSHELRTPLMSIRGYAESIEYGITDPIESCKVIINETDNMTNMVEDLLYISRVDNISNAFCFAGTDLRDILSDCAQGQCIIAENKGIKLIYEFENSSVMVRCSEKHLNRAFTNLISNAIRYAKSEVKLICKNDNGNAVISVIDDGYGISDDDKEHIFERFYKGKGGNHGIGLSIVKSVIDQHKGQISVNTSENGTEFLVVLPKGHVE